MPKGGFNVRTSCSDCFVAMAPANMPRHRKACLKAQGYADLFGRIPTTAEMKVFERVLRQKNITPYQFRLAYELQKGQCKICEIPIRVSTKDRKTGVFIDHEHGSGSVRGLLCILCNILLGAARDSRDILRAAEIYLRISEEGHES